VAALQAEGPEVIEMRIEAEDEIRRRNRDRYRDRRAAGLCGKCGAEPRPGEAKCDACARRDQLKRRNPCAATRYRAVEFDPTRTDALGEQRRATHAAILAALDDGELLRNEARQHRSDTLDRKRAVASVGFDDLDTPWDDSPSAQEAVRRFGAMGLDDIAILWGMSRERVRQIEARAALHVLHPETLARAARAAIRERLTALLEGEAEGLGESDLRARYVALDEAIATLEAIEGLRSQVEDPPAERVGVWDRMDLLVTSYGTRRAA
jgi:hypothetical protein